VENEELIQEPVETQQIEQQEKTPVEQAAPTPQESFRELRSKMERIEQERDEYARMVQQMQQPKQQQEEDEEIRLNPDELVEGKHLSAYEKKLRKIEQKIQQQAQKNEAMNAEAMIRIEMPDFDKVVTKDAVQALQYQYPELAESIANNNNLHSKAKAAYQAIQKLNLSQNYSTESEIITKNTAKPKPLASLSPAQGDSPLTHANAFANGLTQDLKDKLYKEMLDAASR
jgi:DNA/RNA-binding domain of Phe-tRNA-synthetase-like protein